MKQLIILCLAFIGLLFCCKDYSVTEPPCLNSLDDLPKDLGGVHKAFVLGADSSPYGYYLYTPSGYGNECPRFPLLVFLHGLGQIGNSKDNAAELDKILDDGPPHLIKVSTWAPRYPMIVASAQCHDSWWDANKVKSFVEFIRTTYLVDTLRVYLTGLSMGGYATYDQLMLFGAESHLAAAVPIAGSGTLSTDKAKKAAQVPLWAFHSENDKTVLPAFSKEIVKEINKLNPTVPAKLTMYAGTVHNCWTKTYDGTGMGMEAPAYAPFNEDIYSWMLQYTKK